VESVPCNQTSVDGQCQQLVVKLAWCQNTLAIGELLGQSKANIASFNKELIQACMKRIRLKG
jgi:hypothetical protein